MASVGALKPPIFQTSSWMRSFRVRPLGNRVQSFPQRQYSTSRQSIDTFKFSGRVIWTLISANTAVFLAWQAARNERATSQPLGVYVDGQPRSTSSSKTLIQTMYENFTVSIPVLTRYPEKAYTLLTSTFSHRDLGHFVFNMVTFHTFASILRYRGITGPQLLTLYIGSGIVGSLGFVINEALNARRSQGDRRIHTALGASGAVMGLGATAALLAPSTQILIFFIPAPLWLAVSGYLAVDWFYMNDPRTRTAHAGHIGGALFGAAYWFIRLKGRRL